MVIHSLIAGEGAERSSLSGPSGSALPLRADRALVHPSVQSSGARNPASDTEPHVLLHADPVEEALVMADYDQRAIIAA